MLNELWVTIHVYLLKGKLFTYKMPQNGNSHYKKLFFSKKNQKLSLISYKIEGAYSGCGKSRLASGAERLIQTQRGAITAKETGPTISTSWTSFHNLKNLVQLQRTKVKIDGSLVLKGKKRGKNETWQLPLEQAVEEVKKREQISGTRRNTVARALHFEG